MKKTGLPVFFIWYYPFEYAHSQTEAAITEDRSLLYSSVDSF